MESFERKANFPNVLGAIDGTHIQICLESFERKANFSNVLGAIDGTHIQICLEYLYDAPAADAEIYPMKRRKSAVADLQNTAQLFYQYILNK